MEGQDKRQEDSIAGVEIVDQLEDHMIMEAHLLTM